MLSSRSRYALRALCHMAECAPAPQTTDQIASATGLPPASLSKILQVLNQAGIVKTQRGVGGGVGLARAPQCLNVKEVVDAVDATRCETHLPREMPCHCLQRRLRIIMGLADYILQQTTIAELVDSEHDGERPHSKVDAILNEFVQTVGIELANFDE